MDVFAERPGIGFTATFKCLISIIKCSKRTQTTINGNIAFLIYGYSISKRYFRYQFLSLARIDEVTRITLKIPVKISRPIANGRSSFIDV